MGKTTRLDSDGIWLSRELEKIEDRVFEVQYADIVYPTLLPVDTTTVGPADDLYTYRVMDRVGKFKTIQDRARDLPRVDITRKEITQRVISIGASYGYTVQEVKAARSRGLPLQESRVTAFRRAYEERVNDIALYGDTDSGLQGFLNNTDIDKLNVTLSWITNGSTADEMLSLLNTAVTYMVAGTNMIEKPNTILMAYEDWNRLNTTPRSSTSDTTVLSYFLANDPYITSIIPLNELNDFSGANKNRMVIYNRSPEKLKLMMPQMLETFPPEREGMEYTVDGYARVMGTTIYYPKSVLYVDQV
jgi:hypothetical protein